MLGSGRGLRGAGRAEGHCSCDPHRTLRHSMVWEWPSRWRGLGVTPKAPPPSSSSGADLPFPPEEKHMQRRQRENGLLPVCSFPQLSPRPLTAASLQAPSLFQREKQNLDSREQQLHSECPAPHQQVGDDGKKPLK